MSHKRCKERESWHKFCSFLGVETNVRKLWSLVHKISGVYKSIKVPVLQIKGQEAINSDKENY